MTTKRISMAAAALLATILGAGVALAQGDAPSPRAPMKQGGADQPGMMDMSKNGWDDGENGPHDGQLQPYDGEQAAALAVRAADYNAR